MDIQKKHAELRARETELGINQRRLADQIGKLRESATNLVATAQTVLKKLGGLGVIALPDNQCQASSKLGKVTLDWRMAQIDLAPWPHPSVEGGVVVGQDPALWKLDEAGQGLVERFSDDGGKRARV